MWFDPSVLRILITGPNDCVESLEQHCLVVGKRLEAARLGGRKESTHLPSSARYCPHANVDLVGLETASVKPQLRTVSGKDACAPRQD